MSETKWQANQTESPWTAGDANIAREEGEPFGPVEIMTGIYSDEGLVCLVPAETLKFLPLLRAVPEMVAALEYIADASVAGIRHNPVAILKRAKGALALTKPLK